MRALIACVALAFAGCVQPMQHTTLPLLARDRAAPGPALLEHALADFFTGPGPGTREDPPTVCVELSPGGLQPSDEEALMARFPRLAPRDRCQLDERWTDRITGERAVLLQAYSFACADADHCTGWINARRRPATRWTMVWQDGAWQFASDRRMVAE